MHLEWCCCIHDIAFRTFEATDVEVGKGNCCSEARNENTAWRQEKKLLYGGKEKRNCCRGGRRKKIAARRQGKKMLHGGRKRKCCTEAREKKSLLWM